MPTTSDLLLTSLHPHQRVAIRKARHALATYGGALIADEMGLGKTLVAVYCVLRLIRLAMERQTCAYILVLAPSSVLYEWRTQLQKHLNRDRIRESQLKVYAYQPGQWTYERRIDYLRHHIMQHTQHTQQHTQNNYTLPPSAIVLASYGLARNDGPELLRNRWTCVVCDECHVFKNPDAQLTQTIRRNLPKHIPRLGLTGTPNANQPVQDMCSLARILFPTLSALHTPDTYDQGMPPLLDKVLVCRTAKDVGLQLPPMTVRTVKLTYRKSSTERDLYWSQLRATSCAYLFFVLIHHKTESDRRQALKRYLCALNMLGKYATHPQVSDIRHRRMHPLDTRTSLKEAYVHKVIREYAIRDNEKLIVTADSTAFLKVVFAKTEQNHPGTSVMFTGETNTLHRAKVLQQWRSNASTAPNVLLLSMKAGGVGLTLIEACRLICVDGYTKPNPSDRAQVIKRIHRIGQTRPVLIEDLCIKGTLDDVMRKYIHPSRMRVAKEVLGKATLKDRPSKQVTQKSSTHTKQTESTTTLSQLCGIGSVLVTCWEAVYGPSGLGTMDSCKSDIDET